MSVDCSSVLSPVARIMPENVIRPYTPECWGTLWNNGFSHHVGCLSVLCNIVVPPHRSGICGAGYPTFWAQCRIGSLPRVWQGTHESRIVYDICNKSFQICCVRLFAVGTCHTFFLYTFSCFCKLSRFAGLGGTDITINNPACKDVILLCYIAGCLMATGQKLLLRGPWLHSVKWLFSGKLCLSHIWWGMAKTISFSSSPFPAFSQL